MVRPSTRINRQNRGKGLATTLFNVSALSGIADSSHRA